jgi:guanine deaminase
MIVAGQLLLNVRPRQMELAEGWLRIDEGHIAEVARGPCPHTIDLGGHGYFITPGFIDTHVHLPQFDSIGCDGLPLLEWLEKAVFPRERLWEDTAYAAAMTERVLRQFLSHGTTSFCAYATVHYDATVAALELAQQRGLRACIGQTLMDCESPEYLMRPTRQLIDEVQALLERFPPNAERVEFGVTPRFAIDCTPELMQAVAKMAQTTGAVVQTHLAETIPECEWVAKVFHNQPYAAVYAAMGLLGERTLLGHGIHLGDAEIRLLRDARSIIAHCPTANTFLQSGIMPRRRWHDAGVRLSLGSDIGAGVDVSMPRVARAMIDAAKYLAFEHPEWKPPSAAEAWWQITLGNAEAVGWPQIGRLQTGAEADLLIIRPQIAWQNAHDPLSMLLYSWDSRWIERVLIAGKVNAF